MVCSQCKKKFTKTHHIQKYCSKKCSEIKHRASQKKWKEEHKKSPIRICVQCNKQFIQHHGQQKLCSVECRKIFRSQYVKKYVQSDKHKESQKRFNQLESTKKYLREYRKAEKNIQHNKAYPKTEKGTIITRKEAKANGLKLYFTGNPCVRGHITERIFPSGDCLECLRIKRKDKFASAEGKIAIMKRIKKYETSEKGKVNRRKLYKKYYQQDMKDINKRILFSLESNFKRYFKVKNASGKRIRQVENLLGLDIEGFKSHLRKSFYADMTMENYGSYWHIDHIIPKSSFDLNDVDQSAICWHYTNLEPLLATDNLHKQAKLIKENVNKVLKKRTKLGLDNNLLMQHIKVKPN